MVQISAVKQRLTPCLWFDSNAEEAVNFYVSVFEDSRIISIAHFTKANAEVAGKAEGDVLTIAFELCGQEFMAINGGPEFSFTPAISFVVNCTTQSEIDAYWDKLLKGGQVLDCGWLTDKYGIAWQVIPTILVQMLLSPDAEKANNVTKAMLKMKKIEIGPLEEAYAGKIE